ncbi:MAG: sensor histidine kinase [Nocardioides sp.]|uniref:sensor histidine kinase n=1 Tax=Nocardioides sp. TaxID=35761 RepID=UPI0039E6944F
MVITGRPTVVDWLVTVGTLLVMLVTASVRTGTFAVPQTALLVATLLAWLPLVVRTRLPRSTLTAVAAIECCHIALLGAMDLPRAGDPMGAYQPVPIATMIAAFTLAGRARPSSAWPAACAASAALLISGLVFHGRDLLATDMVAVDLVIIATAVGAVGNARRTRVARAGRRIAEEKRQAVLDERLRIARDLHDALAHNLTLVNAQASVADYLLRSDPEAAGKALQDITRHSRQAIDELRATVGLLRYDDATTGGPEDLLPVPGLDQLDDLLQKFRNTGTSVDLVVVGEPRRLGQHADLAAYRIVQEALTNAAKHAPGEPVVLEMHWVEDELRLRLTNPIPAHPITPLVPGTGHGLIGMRERALAAGGTLDADPGHQKLFEVRASLPVATASAPPSISLDEDREETAR